MYASDIVLVLCLIGHAASVVLTSVTQNYPVIIIVVLRLFHFLHLVYLHRTRRKSYIHFVGSMLLEYGSVSAIVGLFSMSSEAPGEVLACVMTVPLYAPDIVPVVNGRPSPRWVSALCVVLSMSVLFSHFVLRCLYVEVGSSSSPVWPRWIPSHFAFSSLVMCYKINDSKLVGVLKGTGTTQRDVAIPFSPLTPLTQIPPTTGNGNNVMPLSPVSPSVSSSSTANTTNPNASTAKRVSFHSDVSSKSLSNRDMSLVNIMQSGNTGGEETGSLHNSGGDSNCQSSISEGSLQRATSRVHQRYIQSTNSLNASTTPYKMQKTLHWKKGAYLGSGAFGSVHLGLNEDTGELMAVKQLTFDPKDPDLANKLFLLANEVTILKKLDHENIVKYYFVEKTENGVNIFMEYVAGGSIQGVLKSFGPLSELVVVQYTFQLLNGLRYLHANSVVHGDIKGANLLLSVDGGIKLADFGASTMQQEGRKVPGGTPVWMAPEVIRGDVLDFPEASDIWSLGCTVMEMLTGTLPWAHLNKSPVELLGFIADDDNNLEFPPNLSEYAVNFLKDCLKRNPFERCTAEQLLQHHFFYEEELPASAPEVLLSEKEIDKLRRISTVNRPTSPPPDQCLSPRLGGAMKLDGSIKESSLSSPLDGPAPQVPSPPGPSVPSSRPAEFAPGWVAFAIRSPNTPPDKNPLTCPFSPTSISSPTRKFLSPTGSGDKVTVTFDAKLEEEEASLSPRHHNAGARKSFGSAQPPRRATLTNNLVEYVTRNNNQMQEYNFANAERMSSKIVVSTLEGE